MLLIIKSLTFARIKHSFMISLPSIVITVYCIYIDFHILMCPFYAQISATITNKIMLDRSVAPRTRRRRRDNVEINWTAFLRSGVIRFPATTVFEWCLILELPTTAHLDCRVVIPTLTRDH